MSKSYEELASELTIAWMNAVGQACASGKFAGNWLNENSVSSTYKTFYNTIQKAVNTDMAKNE